jgi:glycosyltransferase involved in cell wall biosynthesis
LGEDVVLLLAGPDYGALAVAEAASAGQPWEKQVVWAGGLFGAEKAAALAWAEVFALPSRHEGFSVAVLEAMRSGLACLITPACHFARAGEVGAAEIVDCEAGAVAGGLQRMINTPGRTLQMGESGRRLVESQYTWESVSVQLKQMYEAVAVRGDSPGGP